MNVVTAFEVYLYDITERIVFVNPSLMNGSSLPLSANEIAGWLASPDARTRFATKIADTYAMNKTHEEIVERLDKMIKGGIGNAQRDKIDRWKKFCALRNAIVHAAGAVTPYLAALWGDRFSTLKQEAGLKDEDVIACVNISLRLAKSIDDQARRTTLGNSDMELLARELFVRYGIDKPADLSFRVSGFLGCHFDKEQAGRVIAHQRSASARADGFFFADDLLKAAMHERYRTTG